MMMVPEAANNPPTPWQTEILAPHCPLPNQQIADTVRNNRAGPGALRVTPGLPHSGWPVPSCLQVAKSTPEPKVAANRRGEESRYQRRASKIIHVKPLDRKRIAV